MPTESIDALLAELSMADDEHPDVSLSHESGWTLSLSANGYLVWENTETLEGPWHQRVEGTEAKRLLVLLAAGDLAAVAGQSWISGYR